MNKGVSFFNKISYFLGSTLIILLLFELLSYIILNFIFPFFTTGSRNFEAPLFNSTDLGRSIVSEYYMRHTVYHPYFMYDLQNYFKGKHLNIKEGKRVTCYNSENPDYIIWMFGGSTLYGSMAENDCVTIPSFISKMLNEKGYNVKVVNYGVSGYYSTQEMIKYLWLLKNGKEKPDLVIFYDGANDATFTIHNNSFLDLPNTYLTFYYMFENPFFPLIKKSNAVELSFKIIKKLYSNKNTNFVADENTERIADSILSNYERNMDYIYLLSSKYNVSVLHFWQPALSEKLKPLSEWEKKQIEWYKTNSPGSIKYYPQTCAAKYIERYQGKIIFLCKIFENETSTLFVDWVHLTSKGNMLVAKSMLPYIEEKLTNKR